MPLENWIQHSRVDQFLYDWQTVIAGVLAFVAGVGTVVAAIWAIWATRSTAREQIAASHADADRQITASREAADKVIAETREQTATTVRLERMRDVGKSVAAASEFLSAVHRCMSAVRGKKKPEIWPTYTDAWNYQRRFRSAYEVVRVNRPELRSNAFLEEVETLLEQLRNAGKSVEAGGEPDENELKKIAAGLTQIVDDIPDRIAPPRT